MSPRMETGRGNPLAHGRPQESHFAALRKTSPRQHTRKYAMLDSEAGKANVVHLMRQGMPEDVAQQIVTTRISVEDLEYGKKSAIEIAAEWNAYQADPSTEKHDNLLQKLQQIGGNSIGYVEPNLEKVLLAISDAGDTNLRILAV